MFTYRVHEGGFGPLLSRSCGADIHRCGGPLHRGGPLCVYWRDLGDSTSALAALAKASNCVFAALSLIDQMRLCKYIHPRKDAFFVSGSVFFISDSTETSRPPMLHLGPSRMRQVAFCKRSLVEETVRLPEMMNCRSIGNSKNDFRKDSSDADQ